MAARYASRKKQAPSPQEAKEEEAQVAAAVYSKGASSQAQSPSEALRPQLLLAVCLLEDRVRPSEADSGYQLVLENSSKLDNDFVDFKVPEAVMPLPPKGSDERARVVASLRAFAEDNAQKQEYVYENGKVRTPRSFIKVDIFEEQGFVKFTNLYHLPASLGEDKKWEISGLMRDVLERNEAGVAPAVSCWNLLRSSMKARDECHFASIEQESRGNPEVARKLSSLAKAYDDMVSEMEFRLRALSEGKRIPDSSIMRASALERKIGRMSGQVAHAMESMFLDALSGSRADEKIERGKKMGLYSQMELAACQGIKEEINNHLLEIKSFSKRAGGDLLSAGLGDLPEIEENFRSAMNLVSNLEALAWKVDLHEHKMRLRPEAPDGGPRAELGLAGPGTSAYASTAQLAPQSRAELERIKKRAQDSCGILKSFVKSMSRESGAITKKQAESYASRIGAQARELRSAMLVSEMGAVSKELTVIGNDLAETVAERRQDMKIEDRRNPWHVRSGAFVKKYTVRYYLAVLGVTTAAGAVIGAIGGYFSPVPGGTAAGAAAGAETGYDTGSLILAAAGTFMASEALYRCLSDTGSTQEALDDLKLGVTFMFFGARGAPLRMLSAPVKLIAGGGAAAASVPLLYEDIKRGNYWEVPADVAYLVAGGTVFVRTLSGAFREVRLSRAVRTMALANSSGEITLTAGLAAKATRAAALPEVIASSVHAGYSPFMVGLNTVFAALSQPYAIVRKLDNKDYSGALSVLGGNFARVTREMVTFDFALAGLGAAASTTIRLKAPVSQAGLINFLYHDGLFERITTIAAGKGADVADRKVAQQLIDLAFQSQGRVSPEYVRSVLGIKRLQDAAEISHEIADSWKIGREVFAEGRKMRGLPVSRRRWNVARWKKVKARMEKVQKGREGALKLSHLKVPVMIGGIAYLHEKDMVRQKREYDMERLTTEHEMRFINRLRLDPPSEYVDAKIGAEELSDAIGLVNGISEGEEGSSAERKWWMELPGSAERRVQKKILFSCALAILMGGEEVTRKKLSDLFSDVKLAARRAQVPLDARTRVDTIALMASVVGMYSIDAFTKRYSYIVSGYKGAPPTSFTDHAVAATYASAFLGNAPEWGRGIASAAFISLKKRGMEESMLGWELLDVYLFFTSHDFFKWEIEEDRFGKAIAAARMRNSPWGMRPSE